MRVMLEKSGLRYRDFHKVRQNEKQCKNITIVMFKAGVVSIFYSVIKIYTEIYLID